MGDSPSCSGVALYRNEIFQIFVCRGVRSFSIVFNFFFKVCTFRSANPFVARWLGAECFRKMPFSLQYCWKFGHVKIVALSHINTFAYLWNAKILFRRLIVLFTVGGWFKISHSAHLDFASTTTKKYVWPIGPVYSMWMRSNSCLVTATGVQVPLGGIFICSAFFTCLDHNFNFAIYPFPVAVLSC